MNTIAYCPHCNEPFEATWLEPEPEEFACHKCLDLYIAFTCNGHPIVVPYRLDVAVN